MTVVLTGSPELTRASPASRDTADPAATLLAGYREHSTAALRKLSGPFAAVILDRSSWRAVLAIDRMGIERLTYCAGAHGIVFSTSAARVALSPEVHARLDLQGLFEYLFHHMIPAPRTVYQRVHKLQAGCCAIYENGAIRVERYWEPRFETGRGASFETLKSELHQSLRSAVAGCIASDGTVGAFLSGGLDSSTVAGMLGVVGQRRAQTFSIGFGYPDYDELGYARIVNAHFGCEGHEHVIHGSDIVAAFGRIAAEYDEPFGNSSALPTYYCARLARDHGVTHLLAGDGGDELFAGNSRYAEQRIFSPYRLVPERLRPALLEPARRRRPAQIRFPFVRKVANYIRRSAIPLPDRLEQWNLLVRLELTEVLHSDFLAAVEPRLVFEQMRELWDSTPSNDYLRRMLYYDWQYTLADNDLRKVGTMCALAGVRVSYPMLDSAVVEVSTRVPARLLMPGRELRDFYKRAMRGFLPDAVITKKKHGFGLPFGLWLEESADLRQLIHDNLTDLRKRRILRPEFIDRLLRMHREEDSRYYGVFVWVIAMLEQWMREHKVTP